MSTTKTPIVKTKITSSTIALNTSESFKAKQNLSSIREASEVLGGGTIKPVLGAVLGGGRSSNQDLGRGGSTGGVIDNVMDKRMNAGAVSGGNAMVNPRNSRWEPWPASNDPEDKPGTGWFGFSTNTKENLAAGAAVAGWVASKPIPPQAKAAAAATAGVLGVLSVKGTPVPDDFITGTFTGLSIGRNGVSFDPLTGMGPSRTQTLGQFTGDQIRGSGVLMTREEVSNLNKALGQASGSHEKTPNPITGSANSGVIDNNSTQHIQFLMAGGGASGPMMQGGEWQAALASVNQFQDQFQAALA